MGKFDAGSTSFRALPALLVLAGCAAQVGTGAAVLVPEDGASQCEDQCARMGMRLQAVVVSRRLACVCTKGDAGPAAEAAAAAVLDLEASEDDEEDRRRRRD